jgi:hypothetical protein
MKLISKKIIGRIGNNLRGIGKIELIVKTEGGLVGQVPAVSYRVFNADGQERIWNQVACRGYWRPGKWKARDVANEVWTYYQSRGINTRVIDVLG